MDSVGQIGHAVSGGQRVRVVGRNVKAITLSEHAYMVFVVIHILEIVVGVKLYGQRIEDALITQPAAR